MTMTRTLLAAAVTLICLGVVAGGGAATGRTALQVVYYEDPSSPETRVVRTLRCDPVGGNHPRRTAACRELERLGVRTLLPVPRNVACTEIYGGPMVATVKGTIDGRRVWVKLRRDNGCEIDRWNRNWFLVPSDVVR
jgi:hypothetical protein